MVWFVHVKQELFAQMKHTQRQATNKGSMYTFVMRILIFFLIGSMTALFLGCTDPDAATNHDQITQIATDYTAWPSPMETAVNQSSTLYLLCRMMSDLEQTYADDDVHGGISALSRVYVNDAAVLPTLSQPSTRTFPDGTILVKEKLLATDNEEALDALGIMLKTKGVWEYAYWQPNGTIGQGKEVAHCQSCHESAAASDYVFYPQGALGPLFDFIE